MVMSRPVHIRLPGSDSLYFIDSAAQALREYPDATIVSYADDGSPYDGPDMGAGAGQRGQNQSFDIVGVTGTPSPTMEDERHRQEVLRAQPAGQGPHAEAGAAPLTEIMGPEPLRDPAGAGLQHAQIHSPLRAFTPQNPTNVPYADDPGRMRPPIPRVDPNSLPQRVVSADEHATFEAAEAAQATAAQAKAKAEAEPQKQAKAAQAKPKRAAPPRPKPTLEQKRANEVAADAARKQAEAESSRRI